MMPVLISFGERPGTPYAPFIYRSGCDQEATRRGIDPNWYAVQVSDTTMLP